MALFPFDRGNSIIKSVNITVQGLVAIECGWSSPCDLCLSVRIYMIVRNWIRHSSYFVATKDRVIQFPLFLSIPKCPADGLSCRCLRTSIRSSSVGKNIRLFLIIKPSSIQSDLSSSIS